MKRIFSLTTALVVLLGLWVEVGPTAAGATTTVEGTFGVSPTDGPVGTVVTLDGDVGPGCAAQAAGPGGSLFLQFERGSGFGQPNEWINVPIAPDGQWSASFVIPAFVGGQAMTQGGPGADVTSGTWLFGLPSCGGPAPLVAFDVTGTSPVTSRFTGMAATPDGKGYWLVQAGGGVFAYGDAPYLGSLPGLGVTPAAPITGITPTPDGKGYWLVGADGGVFAFGDAGYFGSLDVPGFGPLGVITGIAPTPKGKGYRLVGADGGVFAFGDATYEGNGLDGVPKVGILPTLDGNGYLLPTATGIEPSTAGDTSLPQQGPMALTTLLSGAAGTPDGKGYWQVGTDGGVFAFGGANYLGSLPAEGIVPAAPVVGIARALDGNGYWLVGADGGVFAFGDAGYLGSAAGSGLPW